MKCKCLPLVISCNPNPSPICNEVQAAFMHPTSMTVESKYSTNVIPTSKHPPTCVISVSLSLSDLTSDHQLQYPQFPFKHLHLSCTTSEPFWSPCFYCLSLFPTLYLHILQPLPNGHNVLHNKRKKRKKKESDILRI